MAGVFLSYDRDDADKARALALTLERAGHAVWWDLHVRGGAQFSKVIEEALKAADAVIVLWSNNSVESAWVRDEAAAGRDRGRLIPVTIDGTQAPLGFRQFQTIDCSRWNGRGKAAEVQTLLAAIDAVTPAKHQRDLQPASRTPTASSIGVPRRWLIGPAVAALLLVFGLLALWRPWNRAELAVVAVRASDQTAASQALAHDLVVQLGALRSVLSSSMRLVNAGSGKSDEPDLVFQTTALGDGTSASLVLSNSKDEVLWSKQFADPNINVADRRQQIAFTAAGVLRCALQESSGEYGRLDSDMRQAYLDACAASTDTDWDTRSLINPLRQVTEAAPKFRPAWAQLLMAEVNAATLPENINGATEVKRALRRDLMQARKLFPDMAEATVAEYTATPNLRYSDGVALLDKAKSQDPDNVRVLREHSIIMASVGRIADSLDDLQRATQLDPVSPVTRSYLIRALVFAGRVDAARTELARAKQLWPGTKTVSQAEMTIDLRYGDFEKAMRVSGDYHDPEYSLYVAARRNPNEPNVSRFIDIASKNRNDSDRLGFRIQALGELNRIDDLYDLLANAPVESGLDGSTFILFRPWLAGARKDPRFMLIAGRLGLIAYWRTSGQWPDFCRDPELPYDCKAEAAKFAA
jgi:tetratricopeptide (TPR) repeat protein